MIKFHSIVVYKSMLFFKWAFYILAWASICNLKS